MTEQTKEKSAGVYQQNHIDVLDGIRAVTITIIVWFHFWQQTWIMPIWGKFNIDWMPRSGAICVDMMILLSGFCLFLPYARQMVYGTETASAKEFYIKRAARIMPSYYASVFICLLFFALPLGEYYSKSFMIKDLVTHIFFVNNFWADTLISTKLNVVLWTVAVEIQLYILFPFIARCFQKKPVLTYCVMVSVGLLSCWYISANADIINLRLYVNHTLTFFSVFANGMLGAWAYIAVTKETKPSKASETLFFALTMLGLTLYKMMCKNYIASQNGSKWQVDNRFLLSLVFLLLLFSILMAQRIFQPVLGNKLMGFLAGISFNMYIWHQYIAVKLKEFRIPYWEGNVPPNQLGDRVWMWKYQILCIAVSLVVAVAMTYLIEKPLSKVIIKKFKK